MGTFRANFHLLKKKNEKYISLHFSTFSLHFGLKCNKNVMKCRENVMKGTFHYIKCNEM